MVSVRTKRFGLGRSAYVDVPTRSVHWIGTGGDRDYPICVLQVAAQTRGGSSSWLAAGSVLSYNVDQECWHVYEGGLFACMRSVLHALAFEGVDRSRMIWVAQQLLGTHWRLVGWRQLQKLEREFVTRSLAQVAQNLARSRNGLKVGTRTIARQGVNDALDRVNILIAVQRGHTARAYSTQRLSDITEINKRMAGRLKTLQELVQRLCNIVPSTVLHDLESLCAPNLSLRHDRAMHLAGSFREASRRVRILIAPFEHLFIGLRYELADVATCLELRQYKRAALVAQQAAAALGLMRWWTGVEATIAEMQFARDWIDDADYAEWRTAMLTQLMLIFRGIDLRWRMLRFPPNIEFLQADTIEAILAVEQAASLAKDRKATKELLAAAAESLKKITKYLR